MSFVQSPPTLGDSFADDRVLRGYLARALPTDAAHDILPTLAAMGALAGDSLYRMQLEDRLNEPTLVQWDAWGNRVDRIEVSPLWKEAARIAAEHGVVGTAYERKHGALSRVHQFALVYLFAPSTDVYSCPLAMTDGAARTLLVHGNQPLIDRAVAHLTSRDPATTWTSGQWMTERTGGSDVGISETVARKVGDEWQLFGDKWFTSATTSQMALTLARPEGNPAGGRGLALFYLERDREDGRSNGITVNRLKDKLGTRKVPTAELTLEGTLAEPVVGLDSGIRNISPMLTVTRTWNAVCAVSGMRRAIALSRDYGQRRVAFGAKLADKPLHVDTLAGMQAEFEAAFHLAFRGGRAARPRRGQRRRAGRRRRREAEALEVFGGAGYVENTGVPVLLTRRADLGGDQAALLDRRARPRRRARRARPRGPPRPSRSAARATWKSDDRPGMEAGARRFAMTLGRATSLALLCEHAGARPSGRATTRDVDVLSARRVHLLRDVDARDSSLLAEG